LHKIGVLAYVLPELAEGDGMAQRADFHDHDVLEHSFRCVRYAPKEVRLAALLHDVGKPKCMKENGKFAEHEIEGALLTAQILGRWKAGKKLTDQTCRLVRLHMYDYDGKTRENKVRRVIVQNLDILENLLSLKQADYSACKDNLGQAPVVQRWRNILQQMKKEGIPLSLKELKIRGDLLIANGIPPKEVGTILEKLLNECVSHAVPNTQARLLKMALQLHAQGDNG
jgi:tRNA nucleotidyltransferase (CCA-adding enzyme)